VPKGDIGGNLVASLVGQVASCKFGKVTNVKSLTQVPSLACYRFDCNFTLGAREAMRRREFLSLLCGAAVVWPAGAHAQQPTRMARLGRLSPLSASAEGPMLNGLRTGLQELGWVEGKNISFDLRFAEGHFDRLPALAADLVGKDVDIIVAGSTHGALAAKRATDKTPIVFVTTGDPVAGGLVSSLARPGGNLTGVTTLGVELNPKRLELLKEAFIGLSRVAVFTNPGSPNSDEFHGRRDDMVRSLGIELSLIEIRDPHDLPVAFRRARTEGAGGVMVLPEILFVTHRQSIVDLAAKTKLPAIYPDRAFTDAGGLMFYGAGLPAMYRHAAAFVDKVLKGAKPADLPVEQPTKFELVVNLRTARAMGLQMSESFLLRADQLVE
jgi:putative ABC transport system substrate-binding protein